MEQKHAFSLHCFAFLQNYAKKYPRRKKRVHKKYELILRSLQQNIIQQIKDADDALAPRYNSHYVIKTITHFYSLIFISVLKLKVLVLLCLGLLLSFVSHSPLAYSFFFFCTTLLYYHYEYQCLGLGIPLLIIIIRIRIQDHLHLNRRILLTQKAVYIRVLYKVESTLSTININLNLIKQQYTQIIGIAL